MEIDARRILDALPALVWTARPDGRLDFVSRRWCEYTGISSEEAPDWGWQRAFHPEDLAELLERWRALLASGEAGEIEARLRRFDGVCRWFLLRANPLRDDAGNIVKWYGTNTDIDGRKRIEEELRRSEAFLAEAQRLSSTGNFSWCVDTDQTVFSAEFYRILELGAEAPLAIDQIAARVHPEDLPWLVERIAPARDGIEDFSHEIRLLMPDGRVKYLATVAHAIRHQDGRLEYLGTIQDITEHRLAEEALGKLRTELARVTRVTSLGVMAASIAHEVNQPLSGIMTNAGTCLRMLAADPPNVEGAQETARRAIRDANRATEVRRPATSAVRQAARHSRNGRFERGRPRGYRPDMDRHSKKPRSAAH
ncbi:MAG: PAS domain-containing protein [Aliidongia sp.]